MDISLLGRMMTDHEVTLVQDSMLEFYVKFHGPKDSELDSFLFFRFLFRFLFFSFLFVFFFVFFSFPFPLFFFFFFGLFQVPLPIAGEPQLGTNS